MDNKWRILVVDDEPDVRLVIKTTLEPKYEIVEAHDGLDALEKLERYEPDFVLMDVMMPLMNGFEACAAIRKNQKFRDVPVMFLSALGGKDDIKKGYSHGANLYLTKPFDPARLMRNVDLFFEQQAPERRNRRHSLADLQNAEKVGVEPLAPGSSEFEKPKRQETAPQMNTTEVELEPQGAPRVMVVDDDEEIIELMRVALDGITETVWARDGLDAIEKLVRYQPDMLIVDIMLPKMNGFQLCQSLRANRAFGRIPIMMCSAKGADRDITFAKRLGANDYLVKPFSPADLIKKTREMQKLPGFRIRPKTYTIDQIRDMESPGQHRDVFNADEEVKEKDGGRGPVGAIGKFLAKEGKKEALDRQQQQLEDEDKKKRRRFFGLGGKE